MKDLNNIFCVLVRDSNWSPF